MQSEERIFVILTDEKKAAHLLCEVRYMITAFSGRSSLFRELVNGLIVHNVMQCVNTGDARFTEPKLIPTPFVYMTVLFNQSLACIAWVASL